MSSSIKSPQAETFIEGDRVVLARGPYTGTPGVFLHSREDVKWADIIWRNGVIWSHPLEWLAHAASAPADV